MRYFLILCISFLLLASGCNKDNGCAFNESYDVDGVRYGHVNFTDSGKLWLSDSLPAFFTLINNKGFSAKYTLIEDKTYDEKYEVNRYDSTEGCDLITVIDYISVKEHHIKYESKELPYLEYKLQKSFPNLNGKYIDTTGHREILYVVMYNHYQYLYPFDTNSSTYMEDVTLAGETFRNVYEFKGKSRDGLYPAKIYFNMLTGMVGYILSNGEEWKREL